MSEADIDGIKLLLMLLSEADIDSIKLLVVEWVKLALMV